MELIDFLLQLYIRRMHLLTQVSKKHAPATDICTDIENL